MKEKNTSLDRIHPELNIEKWSIWQPAHSRRKPKRRVIERHTDLEDGNKIIATVEVGFTDWGVLTTDDQKVYYAIIKIWEAEGRPQIIYFSLRRLAKMLNKKWGTGVAKSIVKSLRKLHDTPFAWIDSYFDSTTKKNARHLKSFHILSDLQILEKSVDENTTKQACCCRFHDLIDNNLRNNHTKPLLFNTIISFDNDIAQLLYKHIDLIMADKFHYERRSKALLEDLGLEGQDYNWLSHRKRILEKACKEINGKPISTGFIKVAIKQTEDQKDYKLVFDKVKVATKPKTINIEATQPKPQQNDKTTPPSPSPSPSQNKPESKTVTLSAPQQLVHYFYKLFHNLDTPSPTAKEIGQAATLINDYGLDLAKYTIEFSRAAAAKTNFQPQTFGGILHYAPKAAAQFVKNQQLQQQQLQQQAQQQQQEQEAREKIVAHLRTTLAERFTIVEQQASQQLLRESPFLQGMEQTTLFKDHLYHLMLYLIRQENTSA